jgi:hypothetical protein
MAVVSYLTLMVKNIFLQRKLIYFLINNNFIQHYYGKNFKKLAIKLKKL